MITAWIEESYRLVHRAARRQLAARYDRRFMAERPRTPGPRAHQAHRALAAGARRRLRRDRHGPHARRRSADHPRRAGRRAGPGGRPPGRTRLFLRDWLPFVVIFLAYELMRGIADDAGFPVHVTDVIAAERWLFAGTIPPPGCRTGWRPRPASGRPRSRPRSCTCCTSRSRSRPASSCGCANERATTTTWSPSSCSASPGSSPSSSCPSHRRGGRPTRGSLTAPTASQSSAI